MQDNQDYEWVRIPESIKDVFNINSCSENENGPHSFIIDMPGHIPPPTYICSDCGTIIMLRRKKSS